MNISLLNNRARLVTARKDSLWLRGGGVAWRGAYGVGHMAHGVGRVAYGVGRGVRCKALGVDSNNSNLGHMPKCYCFNLSVMPVWALNEHG